MAKKSKEQSNVSEVQGIEKPVRRRDRCEAPLSRCDCEIRLDYDPSGAISRYLLESFQDILLLLISRSNLPSKTF